MKNGKLSFKFGNWEFREVIGFDEMTDKERREMIIGGWK